MTFLMKVFYNKIKPVLHVFLIIALQKVFISESFLSCGHSVRSVVVPARSARSVVVPLVQPFSNVETILISELSKNRGFIFKDEEWEAHNLLIKQV